MKDFNTTIMFSPYSLAQPAVHLYTLLTYLHAYILTYLKTYLFTNLHTFILIKLHIYIVRYL